MSNNRHRALQWGKYWIVFTIVALCVYEFSEAWPWMSKYPKQWVWPLRYWISDFMSWLVNDLDFGLFTFKELTRSIAWLLEWPLQFARGVLAEGFTFSSNPRADVVLPRVSWLAVIVSFALLAWWIKGWKLALMVTLCFAYLVVFGQWDSAMVTLSSIVIVVPLATIAGLLLGVLSFRAAWFERLLTPVLDIMQTVPVFAYLVPVLFLFGFGAVAAMLATMIYATPPMVRVTLLALKQTPIDIVEYGTMAGSTRAQLLWKVQIPSALPSLMVGVNQVIMLSLNMVIIASMIGAGGLGFDVLTSLKRLAIGSGLEAGIAITLLAIALDRASQAWAIPSSGPHASKSNYRLHRYRYLFLVLSFVVVTMLLGKHVPILQNFPEEWQFTTRHFWDEWVRWINLNYFDQLESVKNFLLLNILIPFKRLLLAIPWLIVVAGLGLAGYQLGGWKLSLLVTAMALFIVVVGLWQKAIITVYLCGISVVFAALIGIPIGLWASQNQAIHKVVQAIIDTLQTLPSFVYLIPVVMLFRVGDFSAMLAVVAYALAPAIRYTDLGIRQVPRDIVEAARAMGCSRWQIMRRVQIPLALPEIMLGINQTIMMALSMLVITALVGTRDLGQEVYIALTKADTGRGITAGICVACITIIADRLINAWAKQKKQQLGISA